MFPDLGMIATLDLSLMFICQFFFEDFQDPLAIRDLCRILLPSLQGSKAHQWLSNRYHVRHHGGAGFGFLCLVVWKPPPFENSVFGLFPDSVFVKLS